MTPDTVRLLAQVIRHSRGMLTAVEDWLVKQDAQFPGTPDATRMKRPASNGLPDSTHQLRKDVSDGHFRSRNKFQAAEPHGSDADRDVP